MARYYARSASDKTKYWLFWFVADERRGGLNVTAEVSRQIGEPLPPGAVFVDPMSAVELARKANRVTQGEKQ